MPKKRGTARRTSGLHRPSHSPPESYSGGELRPSIAAVRLADASWSSYSHPLILLSQNVFVSSLRNIGTGSIISPAERSHSIVSLTERTASMRFIFATNYSVAKVNTELRRKCIHRQMRARALRFTSTANIEATQTNVRFVPIADIAASQDHIVGAAKER